MFSTPSVETRTYLSCALFADLDQLAIPATVRKGVTLFRRDDPVTAIYTVRRGGVALIVDGTKKVQQLRTSGPGSVLGLPGILTGRHSLSAKLITECELGFIEPRVITHRMESDPEFSLSLAKAVARELAAMRSKLISS